MTLQDEFNTLIAPLINKMERADAKLSNLELFEESLADKVRQLQEVGWKSLSGVSDGTVENNGLDLEQLHGLSDVLREKAASNPLHVRGAQLRHAYVFGRGIKFSGLSKKTEKLLENPYNQSVMFSVDAYETNNLALFTDGNFFVIRDEATNLLTTVPMAEITGAILDPSDNSRVRYLRREWDDNSIINYASTDTSKRVLWYPVATYKKFIQGKFGPSKGERLRKYVTTGAGERQQVSQDSVMYMHTTKRQAGWTFGVPDSFAAYVWAEAYSGYLTDNATLVKALSQFAWKVTSQTSTAARATAVQVGTTPSVGGTASLTSPNDLTPMGAPSSNVDFNNGQPLAAMVATSFGVPVIALLSSPGATGGSYGAATTLDEPTLKGMKAIQDSWKGFYLEILNDMGSPKVDISFPNISQDPTYREAQSIATAYEFGLLHQDEARNAIIELLDVEKLHEEMPEAPEKAGMVNAYGNMADGADTAKLASQGNTGDVPGGFDQNTTNHDGDNGK